MLFNSTGTRLVGTRVGTSQIDSFVVDRRGGLARRPRLAVRGAGPGRSGASSARPIRDQLFVSNAHGGADAGTVSAFDAAPDGALTSIGTSPFADDQTAPCWVEISHDGSFLFTVNTAVPSISSYRVGATGRCTCWAAPRSDCGAGLGAVDARLSPDGRPCGSSTARAPVSGFASTAASSSSPRADGAARGATPFGIVVN